MISEINTHIGAILPHWFWDTAQFVLSIFCLALLLAERRFNRRYLTCVRKKARPVKRFFVWCGQLSVGLAGALAILIFADVITPPDSPPRSIIVAFLTVLCLRQMSTCYAAYERAVEDGSIEPGLTSLLAASISKR